MTRLFIGAFVRVKVGLAFLSTDLFVLAGLIGQSRSDSAELHSPLRPTPFIPAGESETFAAGARAKLWHDFRQNGRKSAGKIRSSPR